MEVYDLVIAVGILAVPLNVFAYRILSKYPMVLGEVPRVFHKCLAIVDLLTGISCLGFGARVVYRDSPLIAMFVTMTTMSFTMSSMLLLSLITLDRFIAIRKPLRHLVTFTEGKAKIYAISAITTSCLYTVVHSYLSFDGGRSQKFEDDTNRFSVIIFVVTATVVLSIVVILTVLNVMLVVIVLRVLRGRRDRSLGKFPGAYPGVTNSRSSTENRRRAAKLARTVLVMTAAFYASFIPGTFCVGARTFGFSVQLYYLHVTFVIMQCNCILNPFIYLVMYPCFRRAAIRELFGRCRETDESVRDGNVPTRPGAGTVASDQISVIFSNSDRTRELDTSLTDISSE